MNLFNIENQTHPTIKILKSPNLRFSLLQDYWESNGQKDELAYQQLLQWVANRLADQGKAITMYGLPEPMLVQTELQRHYILHDVETAKRNYESLLVQTPNTSEQQHIFSIIANLLTAGHGGVILIDGKGGKGTPSQNQRTYIYYLFLTLKEKQNWPKSS